MASSSSSSSIADQFRAQHPELLEEWQQLHQEGVNNPAAARAVACYDALLAHMLAKTKAEELPFYREGITYLVKSNKQDEAPRDVSNVFRNLCRLYDLYVQKLQPLLHASYKMQIDDHMAALREFCSQVSKKPASDTRTVMTTFGDSFPRIHSSGESQLAFLSTAQHERVIYKTLQEMRLLVDALDAEHKQLHCLGFNFDVEIVTLKYLLNYNASSSTAVVEEPRMRIEEDGHAVDPPAIESSSQ
jgi:hypothetical protein